MYVYIDIQGYCVDIQEICTSLRYSFAVHLLEGSFRCHRFGA